MQQVPGLPAQPLDEGLGGFEGEAHQVDDGVRSQPRHRVAEVAFGVLPLAVGFHLPHLPPFGCVGVRGALAAADVDDLVARADEPRDQERADVSAAADDDDSHIAPLLMGQVCQASAALGRPSPTSEPFQSFARAALPGLRNRDRASTNCPYVPGRDGWTCSNFLQTVASKVLTSRKPFP
ncbi:hypothetical protein GCM10029992_07100 [Glycomyces albus]